MQFSIRNWPRANFWPLLAVTLVVAYQWTGYLLSCSFGSVLASVVAIKVLYSIFRKFLRNVRISNLESRAVFITGCDSGFGRLLAVRCLEQGMPVFAGCLTDNGANELREETSSLPGKLHTLIVDVANEESVKAAAELLETATVPYGGLHAVVNNAGITGTAMYDDWLTIKDYERAVAVNTFGMIRTTQHTKKLLKRTKGRLIFVTSVLSRVGLPGGAPYTVSKFAIRGFIDVIRQELRHFGVSVHAIEPGYFKTQLINKENLHAMNRQKIWDSANEKIKMEYGEKYIFEGLDRINECLNDISSLRVDKVTDAYFDAITERFPQCFYRVGADAKYMYYIASILPAAVRDAATHFMCTLAGEPIPQISIDNGPR